MHPGNTAWSKNDAISIIKKKKLNSLLLGNQERMTGNTFSPPLLVSDLSLFQKDFTLPVVTLKQLPVLINTTVVLVETTSVKS